MILKIIGNWCMINLCVPPFEIAIWKLIKKQINQHIYTYKISNQSSISLIYAFLTFQHSYLLTFLSLIFFKLWARRAVLYALRITFPSRKLYTAISSSLMRFATWKVTKSRLRLARLYGRCHDSHQQLSHKKSLSLRNLRRPRWYSLLQFRTRSRPVCSTTFFDRALPEPPLQDQGIRPLAHWNLQ